MSLSEERSGTVVGDLLPVTPGLSALQGITLPLPDRRTLPSTSPVTVVTVPLLPPPHSLLLHRPVDPLVHLLHPAGELPVVQVLLDQRQEEPVAQLALGHDPLDDPVVLQVVADVCRLEHGDPEIGEYEGERPAHAADDGDYDEEEEPEPLD